jgi:hypothetical protein
LIALLACPVFSDETARGWLCVAHLTAKLSSNLFIHCSSRNLSLRIDAQQLVQSLRKGSLKIEDLDLTESHLVVAMCDGKVIQSFRFKFSTFKKDRLCLAYTD